MVKEEEQGSTLKDILAHDIACLKELLQLANEHVNCLTHPLMIRISQMLDQKLNQYQHLGTIKQRPVENGRRK